MNKKIKWWLLNIVFAIAIYLGFIDGIDGAKNIAYFIAWSSIVLSLFMFSDEVIDKMAKEKRSVPSWASALYDLSVTAVFVWFGAWVTGLFYLIHFVIIEAAWSKSEKTVSETT